EGTEGSFRRISCMMAAHSGAAERTARVARIGRPAELPAHTATVCSLSHPPGHASRKPLLVRVFTAIGSSNERGESRPKLFLGASLSHNRSVTISVADSDATRVIG